MAEGAPLLREYGLKAHRGFESLSLRQKTKRPLSAGVLFSDADGLDESTEQPQVAGSTNLSGTNLVACSAAECARRAETRMVSDNPSPAASTLYIEFQSQ